VSGAVATDYNIRDLDQLSEKGHDMRRLLAAVTGTSLAVLLCCAMLTAAEVQKIRVLLITGDDASAHNWKEMATATRKVLDESGKFDVKVCEDPMILDSAAALKPYDVIAFLIYATAKTPMITSQAQENLLNFVKEGKGFYVQHLATASFPAWDEFGKLCGRKWVMKTSGHGPRTPFEAKVVNHDHPITKGMSDFNIDDELYSKLQGSEPITVLVEADSPWSKKTEPLVFVHQYGNGNVVQNAFGHDGKAITDPNVAKLIVRGVQWAAQGKVSD
jgi:uncharacterized protein